MTERLRHTQVENNRANKVIQSRDTTGTFVYADPPYIDTDQGHYGGYTEEHFKTDLNALSRMKGRFLLSSFPSSILDDYINEFNWHSIPIKKPLSASNGAKSDRSKKKIEVLTANYPIG